MVGGHFSAAQFYIDAEVHQDSDAFRYALEELEFFTHQDQSAFSALILLIRHSARAKSGRAIAPNHAGGACAFWLQYPIHGKGRLDGRSLCLTGQGRKAAARAWVRSGRSSSASGGEERDQSMVDPGMRQEGKNPQNSTEAYRVLARIPAHPF